MSLKDEFKKDVETFKGVLKYLFLNLSLIAIFLVPLMVIIWLAAYISPNTLIVSIPVSYLVMRVCYYLLNKVADSWDYGRSGGSLD